MESQKPTPKHAGGANTVVFTKLEPPSVAVSAAQSTQMVKALLHASLSCIAFLRVLFSEKCFDNKSYTFDEKYPPLEEHVIGRKAPTASSSGHLQTVVKGVFLRRGRNAAADQFLDWLEEGAFQALEHNVLRALQLRIFEDPAQQEHVIETHTFTFNYIEGPAHPKQFKGLNIKGPEGRVLSVRNAQYTMESLVRQMVLYCQTLPSLPETRYMSMNLFYAEGCNAQYEPPGFCASESDKLFFPNNTSWTLRQYGGGSLRTLYHDVKLTITHLDDNHKRDNSKQSNDGQKDRCIPNGLAYNVAVDPETEILTDDASATVRSSQTPAGELQLSNIMHMNVDSPEPSNRVSDHADEDLGVVFESSNGATQAGVEEEVADDIDLDSPVALKQDLSIPSESFEDAMLRAEGTQRTETTAPLSQDLRTKASLHEMLRSSNPEEQPDMATQAASLLLTGVGAAPAMIEFSSLEPSAYLFGERLPIAQLCFSQKKIEQLQKRRKTNQNSSSRVQNELVDCQCNFRVDEDIMVNCAYCDTWQHIHCYGYLGDHDKRLPEVHACYKCLLEEKESPLLPVMEELAMLRRAIHLIGKKGYTGDTDLARQLKCDNQTAISISARLKNEGTVVRLVIRSKSSSQTTPKARYGLSKDSAVVKGMREKYFNPATNISHHCRLPETQPSLAAPFEASSTQSQTAVGVPDSIPNSQPIHTGFEVPDSMPNSQLLQTPSANGRKRSKVQETYMSTPRRSGRKRLRTSKTKEYLDVGKFS